jgi:uncharacterized lipoprotein YddW (UPF0748 family)
VSAWHYTMNPDRAGVVRRDVLLGVAGAAGAISASLLGLTSCMGVLPQDGNVNENASLDLPPPLPREFRAAWVATVANIDWPSRKGLGAGVQQAQMHALLDQAVALQLNAIILQVRTGADALYASPLEPWSEYLSGVQGQAPEPWYDPLALWIEAAHERGLELHAWLNPFRADLGEDASVTTASTFASNHVSRQHPQWVKTYGNQLWLDPGEPAAREHSLAVVLDVLQRYDVDGIHLDDYFYPYPIVQRDNEKQEADFPDQTSWKRYADAGGKLARDDWRRSNVNAMVQSLHSGIHQRKPWVRFGISPFGIGRPDLRPPGIQGLSQYHKLYADVELWLQSGWVDYLMPQLYWPLAQKSQGFEVLLNYWHAQNSQGRHIWPGLLTSNVLPDGMTARTSWPVQEITQQITAVRALAPGKGQGSGHGHFSMVALMENRRGLVDALRQQIYTQPALVPASPWLQDAAPQKPNVVVQKMAQTQTQPHWSIRLESPPDAQPAARWAVWLRYGRQWHLQISTKPELVVAQRMPLAQGDAADASAGVLNAVAVSAMNRIGVESDREVRWF